MPSSQARDGTSAAHGHHNSARQLCPIEGCAGLLPMGHAAKAAAHAKASCPANKEAA